MYSAVIKNGWEIPALNGCFFNGKIIYQWGIFHCHLWLPLSMYCYPWFLFWRHCKSKLQLEHRRMVMWSWVLKMLPSVLIQTVFQHSASLRFWFPAVHSALEGRMDITSRRKAPARKDKWVLKMDPVWWLFKVDNENKPLGFWVNLFSDNAMLLVLSPPCPHDDWFIYP